VAYGVADKEGVDYGNAAMQEVIAQSILSMYNQFIVPDVTFYLDASIATGLSRRNDTTKEKELYENTTKLKKIEAGYQWLLWKFPQEFTLIDAERTKKEVHKEIMGKLDL
jgi:thymidylate kinase